eukprot:GFUD01036659.1.p1 GENE.GFUD01036659.1~~GFUD01036659.1.p1  ORF type:complete len:315 (+),score=80.96 GFUD01036659.1:74-1018(+)
MENCTVIFMQEGYNNIQYEEVVTAQEVNEEEQYTTPYVSQEFEEAIYEVEIEDDLIYEESLPVYEAVAVYEEVVENTNTKDLMGFENSKNHHNQGYNRIRDVNSSDNNKTDRIPENFKVKHSAVTKPKNSVNKNRKEKAPPAISKKIPRTFEKNKKVKKLKNICESALSINLGLTPDKKNLHKCFLCEKTFLGYDRHVSKANVVKHIIKYHLTGKIAVKKYLKPNKLKYFGFVGSLRILARNTLILSADKKNHKCFICNKSLQGIKSFAMKHIDVHLETLQFYRQEKLCKPTRKYSRENQKKNLFSFGYSSDED